MAKYKITAPDGAVYQITAPDDATPEQLQQFVTSNLQQQKPAGPAGNASAGGIFGGIKMGLRDPIDAGAQMLDRGLKSIGVDTDGISRSVNAAAKRVLPDSVADTLFSAKPVDQIVNDQNAQYAADKAAAGRDGMDFARLAGNVANPVNMIPGNALMKGAQGVKALAIAGAKAGALGGALQPVLGNTDNFWTDKAEQAGAGALAGAVMTPAVAKVGDAAGKGLQRVAERFQEQGGPVVIGRGGISPADLDVAVNRLLQTQGMKAEEMPPVIIDSIKRQIGESLSNRGRIDPAAALRQAQAEAVGLTGDAAPTLGQLTREPMRYAQERNMSGIVINTPKGPSNPLAARFTNQNQRLQELFDNAGAKGAVNAREAGAPLMDALRQADEPVKAGVDDLYKTARGMNAGRAAELDRGHFNQTVNAALDEGMWGRFVPPEVRGMLNDIAGGKAPFNVDAAVQIDGILSAAQRKADRAGDSATRSALGVIRDHLNNTPFAAEQFSQQAPGAASRAAAGTVDNGIDDVAFREIRQQALPSGQRALPGPSGSALATEADMAMPSGGAQGAAAGQSMSDGEAARQAFEQARRAARSRFATIEDTPALKAALDGEHPDDFVRKYVLGGKAEDLRNMRQVLQNSPEALAQARAQIADHLKRAAFGENLAGDKVFAPERYAQALRNLGPDRLRIFFDPQDVMRFNLAGKVAADINSVPAGAKNAVNYSASSSALFNLFQKIIESPLVRNVPGIRSLANQAGEIANERAVQGLAVPGSAVSQQPRELSPEAVRALQRLFAPAAVGAGAAAGSGV